MGISFGSINTGLPKDIVKQIIAAEQVPVQNMEKQKGKIQEKKGLVDQLAKLVEDVRGNIALNGNARSLRELKIDTNNDIVGVTADKNKAVPGNYQFEVVQLAQKSSAMTSGFEDKDKSYTGVGFLRYSLPDGETKDIYIDAENANLTGIAKMINRNSSLGMTANVVNDGSGSDTPWRLVISLNNTGDKALADFPYFYFVDGEHDLELEFQRDAHDAKVKLDGFEIEVPENRVTDLIPGLSIDLKKAKPGEEFSIKVSEDNEAVASKIGDLVSKLNGVLKFIKDQNTMDDKTDTSRTLGGDIMLQTLQGRIHSAVFKDVETDSGFRRVAEIGITFNREGLLEFDQKKFQTQINENYLQVSQILTGTYGDNDGTKTQGFIDNVSEVANMALRMPDGLVQSRKRTLSERIEDTNRRILEKQKRIEEKEKNLKDKFARLEGTISKIRSQGSGISALGASGGNPVQELG